MTRRERVLGAIVGTLLGVMVVGFFGWKLTDSLNVKNGQISALRGEIEKNQAISVRGTRAADEVSEYAEKALPKNASKASHMYRTWLLAQLETLEFEETSLEANQSRPEGDAFDVHQFRASGKGNLEQVTELMHRIESSNIAHRVRAFSIQPIKDSRDLDFSVTTEVMSLDDAIERELDIDQGGDAAAKQLKEYKDKILGRNLFGPENLPPSLDVPRTIEVTVDERVTIKAEASDPDEHDSVSFDADLTEVDGARFDDRSGQFSWLPKRTGEYFVTLYADDDGFPMKTDAQDVRIVVSAAKPVVKQADPPAPPIPGLEKARFAEITAITGSNGVKKIWVSIKSEGRTLRVAEGESFTVGDVEAMVAVIEARFAEVIAADKVYRVELGQRLAEAPVVRDLTKDGAE